MTSEEKANAPAKFSELFIDGRALLTLTLILSVGSHATNLFVTRTVLPSIVEDIGGKELMYWTLALFQITAIVGGMASAQIKSKLGGRHTIYLASVLLVIGSCFAGLASHFELLVFGRAFQGFAEGMLISIAYIILSERYPNNLMARMIGVLAIVWAVSAAIGPLFAGLLEENFGWRSAFLVNLAIAALLSIQARFSVKQQRDQKSTTRVPIARLTLFVAAVTTFCVTGQLSDPLLIALVLIVALLLLSLAIQRDRKAENRMLPKFIFTRKGSIGLGFWINISISLAVGGHAVYSTALLQSIWLLNPMNAGYIASVLAITWSISSWMLSGVGTLKNQLRLIRTGITFISASFLLTAFGWAQADLLITSLGFALMGLGLGTSTIFTDKKIMQAASEAEKDRTSSMLPPIDSAAGAIGAAVASILALSFGLFGGTPVFGIFDVEVATTVAPQLYLCFFALSLPAMLMAYLLPLNDSVEEPAASTQQLA